MGLKLVIERECSRDHQTALRQFLCCEPGGPEWAMDPQCYIRDLSVRKTPKGIMRTLLVVSGDIPLHDDVVGFCEYGVAVETTDVSSPLRPLTRPRCRAAIVCMPGLSKALRSSLLP